FWSGHKKKQCISDITEKNGITITSSDHPFENGKLYLVMSICLTVENTGATPVYFTCYSPLYWLKAFTFVDEQKVTRVTPLLLNPGDTYNIQVGIHCKHVGCFPTTLTFEFNADPQPSSASFHIVRYIEAHCLTTLGRELAPVSPYKPRSMLVCTEESHFEITQIDLNSATTLLFTFDTSYTTLHFPFWHIRVLLESPWSWENYSEKFCVLLYLEELQLKVDICRYNIPNDRQDLTVMTVDPHNKKLLVMEVLGVSENRPSVLRGDELVVCPENERNVKYRGYVHSVHLDSVTLGFGAKLLNIFIEGMKFSVEFIMNRLTLRVQHRAVELAVTSNLRHVLFPAETSSSCQNSNLPKLTLFNRLLEKNPEQYHAIQHIVAGSSRPAPYLLFGPPGTGKTVTLVEAIKQIEKTQTNCHILACAPSNSAADLLCKRIVETHVDKHKVYRMYASCLDPRVVPEELKACSNLVGDTFSYPDKETLMSYKIIVSTMMTAGRLVTGGIPFGHFTHVFLDEAGHAVEPECLIPLAGLLDPESGQVVLAGDHKQLGPIVRSPFALQYGMGVSFLERLMCDFSLYQKQNGVFNNRYVTKLLRNYRSHPAILKIPNELFYDGELQVCADEMLRNSFCGWEHLPEENFPVIFHGVTGIDQREASSPSFFNVAEVEVLMDYVKKLMQTNGKKGMGTISPRDIGIIAPYRKQVQKIRKGLEKVGSVEEFQGQERRVIMVSTVRSSTDYLQMDQKFHLGFVKNEKRFNVAVTRAKALLIVVGNPRVLKSDSTWARYVVT
uniref:RNA helicase n=1 Tax=Gouania willdenowi TaxID=441366 RepID=A0A8C5DFH1_GOUWI